MYGAQALCFSANHSMLFENDVEMYGAQAKIGIPKNNITFENDVEMYGAQAYTVQERTA